MAEIVSKPASEPGTSRQARTPSQQAVLDALAEAVRMNGGHMTGAQVGREIRRIKSEE